MKNRALLIASIFLVVPLTTAHAQLAGTDIAPGASCAGSPTGATLLSADADGNRRGVVLICNGTNWVVEQPTFTGTCADNAAIVYDNSTGGLRCGPVDTIDPIWVTPAGTIATTDVNLTINVVVAASDESGTPTYQKVSGAAWINVATNGTVSGKAPAVGGTYVVVVRATDGSGNTADRTFDVIVNVGAGPAGCPNPGDLCPDGTIYAGISPDGDLNMFTTAINAQDGATVLFSGGQVGTTSYINPATADCTVGGTQSTCRTGQSNTANLAPMDSSLDTGNQIYSAIMACHCLGESHVNAPNGVIPPECSGDPVGTNGLDGFGYDDWYLPAIAELDVMMTNLASPDDPDNPTWQDGASGGSLGGSYSGPHSATFPAGGGCDSPVYHSSSENAGHFRIIFATELEIPDEGGCGAPLERVGRVRCVRR